MGVSLYGIARNGCLQDGHLMRLPLYSSGADSMRLQAVHLTFMRTPATEKLSVYSSRICFEPEHSETKRIGGEEAGVFFVYKSKTVISLPTLVVYQVEG